MDNFDSIQTSIFGHDLLITAEAKVFLRTPQSCEVQIKITYQENTYSFPTNGPLTHPVSLGTNKNNFPEEKIFRELETIKELFLQHYQKDKTALRLVADVMLAYREKGPILKITTSKHTQDVTDGNS